jgi:hypothetical protein
MDTASASMLCRDASVTSVLALCLTHVERELIRRFPNRHAFMKTPNTIDEKVSMTIGIGGDPRGSRPCHTTRHAGPHRAVREVEVMRVSARQGGQSRQSSAHC